jgi:hypothetical protein
MTPTGILGCGFGRFWSSSTEGNFTGPGKAELLVDLTKEIAGPLPLINPGESFLAILCPSRIALTLGLLLSPSSEFIVFKPTVEMERIAFLFFFFLAISVLTCRLFWGSFFAALTFLLECLTYSRESTTISQLKYLRIKGLHLGVLPGTFTFFEKHGTAGSNETFLPPVFMPCISKSSC